MNDFRKGYYYGIIVVCSVCCILSLFFGSYKWFNFLSMILLFLIVFLLELIIYENKRMKKYGN